MLPKNAPPPELIPKFPPADGPPVLLTSALLRDTPAVHAFSTRHGGVSKGPYASLNLSSHVGDDKNHVLLNRQRLLAPFAPAHWVSLRQEHGCNMVEVTRNAGKNIIADGLWTRDPKVMLAILVADCVPIVFVAAKAACVAAVHAGWRGTAAQISAKMVQRLGQNKIEPQELKVVLGPAIGPCCFEIGVEVAQALRGCAPGADAALHQVGERWRADLWHLNRLILEEAGILPGHIDVLARCTHCSPELFSYRRSAALSQVCGRQGALVGLLSG